MKLKRETWLNLLFVAIVFLVLLFVRLQVNHDVTGDEPHYLVVDYSLVHDQDVTLANNYTAGDYKEFYSAPLEGHLSPSKGGDTNIREYSFHGLGLPVIVLPGFLAGERMGAVIQMVILATGVVWLVWAWVLQITKNRRVSYLTASLLVCCYFFNGLAGYLYPNMIIAGIVLASLLIITRYPKEPKFQVLFGALLGILVLVHFKSLTFAAPLFLIMTYRLWPAHKKLLLWTIAGGAPFVLFYFITLYVWLGTLNPMATYPPEINVSILTPPIKTIPAMLFDANRGLLIYNPITLLLFVGLPLWFRQHRSSLLIALCATVPSALLVAMFNQWQGGGAPVGRYIMDFLPVYFPAVALVLLQAKHHWQKVAVWALVLATVAVSLVATFERIPYIYPGEYRTRSTFFTHLEDYSGLALDKLLPNYSNQTTLDDRRAWTKLSLGIIAVSGATYYGYALSKSLKLQRGFKLKVSE
jgi:hypothetical protein